MPAEKDVLVAVIMAGGVGTRFWPLSTPDRPKQFLELFGERTLLESTYDRISALVPPERVLVLTNASFVPLVREQLPEIPETNVIGEPLRRDTAAAVGLAAFLCRRRYGNPVMAVLPADHVIHPARQFREALLSAAGAARRDETLYTFGIPPTYPATGYGYLEIGAQVTEDRGIYHHVVLSFKEKPEAKMAEEYLRQRNFLWNSGIFVWTVDAVLREIERHLPEHYRLLRNVAAVDGQPEWLDELRHAFALLPPVSIDYGVMEKASKVRAVIAPFSWSDVGGWPALAAFLDRDDHNNFFRGRIKVLEAGSNIVFSEDEDEVVALVGVHDLIVVRAGKCTLVVSRRRAEEIKKLVESFVENGHKTPGRS